MTSDKDTTKWPIVGKHLLYEYGNGWTYELFVASIDRVVYRIHGGPMAGRTNFQTAYIQQIREEIYLISWLEETGTIVTMAVDLERDTVTTSCAFSKGHWEQPEKAHGWKRDNMEQWRELAKVGIQTDREMMIEQAKISTKTEGRGDLPEIDHSWPTL